MAEPGRFSRQVIDLVIEELKHREADLSGRYLARHTSMSATYARKRLTYQMPFTTNDLAEMAELFGYTPQDFARTATERNHLRVVPELQDDVASTPLHKLDQAATTKPDTGEPDTP